jgi:ABC-2 type transport system ATP-binding protein
MAGLPIMVSELTKSFGRGRSAHLAVRSLSFTVEPGRITGFLGPNGSGKSTTLRCLLGLVNPTSGEARFGQQQYRDLANPTRQVGAALEAAGFHPGRTARDHLRIMARATGLPMTRTEAVLAEVGLTDAAGRRVGTYSLGMKQRLALAGALLGDPQVLVLDEPANGLDPEGMAWLRTLLRNRAATGATILVSSHVLAEVQQTADNVVIIANGSLIHSGPIADLASRARTQRVRFRSPQAATFATQLQSSNPEILTEMPDAGDPNTLLITGATTDSIGEQAHRAGVVVHELTTLGGDLETAYLDLTGTTGSQADNA